MEIDFASPKALQVGKGFDGDRFRERQLNRGILPIIPSRSKRKLPAPPDHRRYQRRKRIGRVRRKLKQK
jgi:hypothetical protein